ncbi:MAG: 3-methyladenine DNA glycosylase AlkC [Vicingaceae bacterium]|jgi:3-methyladenine DNA glycosylase AlkC
MPEPLKNVYSLKFIAQLCSSWKSLLPHINEAVFAQRVFEGNWEELELKERMSRLSDAMKLVLPNDFTKAATLIKKLISKLSEDGFPTGGFEFMFIPEYIEKNGTVDLEISLDALKYITQFTSCEFAIRPFIILNEKRTMEFMLTCSLSQHPNVRRFASEGCRSRLPWAIALPRFKKDAALILPILEKLKEDESLFVRKSVANNLNDISKDHPELALKLAEKWIGKNQKTDWLVKHGMRTLLKAGHPSVMALFGYAAIDNLRTSSIQVNTPVVSIGNNLKFQFNLENKTQKEQTIRLEYGIYFMKSNGVQNKKVFKISERKLKNRETISIQKSHSIKPISTRKYYPGEHGITLIVNGIEFEKHGFLLNM